MFNSFVLSMVVNEINKIVISKQIIKENEIFLNVYYVKYYYFIIINNVIKNVTVLLTVLFLYFLSMTFQVKVARELSHTHLKR